jgi:hypothetical protein
LRAFFYDFEVEIPFPDTYFGRARSARRSTLDFEVEKKSAQKRAAGALDFELEQPNKSKPGMAC